MTSRHNWNRGTIPYTRPRIRNKQNNVSPEAQAAADRMVAQGGSPRIQLLAAKISSGQQNLTYVPHQGAQEIARRKARLDKEKDRQLVDDCQ